LNRAQWVPGFPGNLDLVIRGATLRGLGSQKVPYVLEDPGDPELDQTDSKHQFACRPLD
jgi:hypothetical protein